jgi:hypothetical protein
MTYRREYLALDDEHLLAQCDVHVYKASGPGGQHRNKVSSAVRVMHRPTRASAHGDDSRSQHTNKRLALRRLRMNIACRVRVPFDLSRPELPEVVRECMFTPKKALPDAPPRLEVGRKDWRFWHVAAVLLDVLESAEGRISDAAAAVGIGSGNFTSLLKDDRHLLAAAQQIRSAHSLKPLT